MPEFQPIHTPAIEPQPDAFTVGYLTCAEWLMPEPRDKDSEGPSSDDALGFSEEAVAEAVRECAEFQAQNAALLEAAYGRGYSEAQAGHDFWLARNLFAVGYWDRDELEEEGLADKLTKAARGWGDTDLYVGDDCWLYFM